eukprot:CAMPEP_0114404690 /NCGR_PEP_ID=MMETSP0102-20121206/19786_1 /TAXON_ID=38822 ORGANISM="Pteridomonas danica, Strain PT" /NCGR_SAMPLE_ID=MMETSP0102 /ASSEMBLY_ACC=CAM_ASM_000212 /LENGTH=96 /DNA_ID=CAMNT_0001569593 /DNA_START=83 /DNA_END=370 /DNA_ORIENTATION=-
MLGMHFDVLNPYLAEYDHNQQFFSEDYYTARSKFRSQIRSAPNAQLHTLAMDHLPDLDLSIDIGIFKGSTKKLVMHISGTHGVEGFAGSAVQNAHL